ncbi:MAG: hypothetical protein HYR66_15140 [Sphingobacteriales bacterium]|nr:hypothetical protein [Sphingobacteriales bacterium]MBI3719161.1 hypothetical protein [Sphingobacteriales bacterium]
MKNIFILSLLLNLSHNGFCQVNKYSLEIAPFLRYDKQSSFYSWETVTNGKNYVRHSGISYGLNLNVRRKVNAYSSVNLGAGFYKLRITNIDRTNDDNSADNRLIKFPSPLFIPFYTDNYSYNTLSGNIGYQLELKLFKKMPLLIGANGSALYTFSQRYNLTSNPEGSTKFKKQNSSMLGILVGFDLGTSYKHERWTIEPKFRIPLLTSIKTDSIFPNENGTDFRRQLFSGIGFGISFIYALKPKIK